MVAISDLRPSPIAGAWYPGEPDLLANQVDYYLDNAHLPELEGEVIALVAPHAGYIYSGMTAGHAFRCVLGQRYEQVALISPIHDYFPAPFLTSAHKGYQTPLGPVWIDQDGMAKLSQAMRVRGLPTLVRLPRDGEHSLEIELPFLQRALREKFDLLPVMVGTHEVESLRLFGEALAETLSGTHCLLVASSDLSHYCPLSLAEKLDAHMLAQITSLSPEGALKAESEGSGRACGVAAISAVLWAAIELGANKAVLVHHSTSADQNGNKSSVVGYGAVAILKGQ